MRRPIDVDRVRSTNLVRRGLINEYMLNSAGMVLSMTSNEVRDGWIGNAKNIEVLMKRTTTPEDPTPCGDGQGRQGREMRRMSELSAPYSVEASETRFLVQSLAFN